MANILISTLFYRGVFHLIIWILICYADKHLLFNYLDGIEELKYKYVLVEMYGANCLALFATVLQVRLCCSYSLLHVLQRCVCFNYVSHNTTKICNIYYLFLCKQKDCRQQHATVESLESVSNVNLTWVSRCIYDVDMWMSSNRLLMNAKKNSIHIIQFISHVDENKLRTIACWWSLHAPDWCCSKPCVVLDSNLTMKKHVDGIVRSCFDQLWQLRSVCRSLTICAVHIQVHAFIHSRVDYCNTI